MLQTVTGGSLGNDALGNAGTWSQYWFISAHGTGFGTSCRNAVDGLLCDSDFFTVSSVSGNVPVPEPASLGLLGLGLAGVGLARRRRA